MECFVGIGGNFENTLAAFRRACSLIALTPCIYNLKVSRIYKTTPVSEIEQADFLNAVCRFDCKLSPILLWERLKEIEKEIGKMDKDKNAPRIIDLDLLFCGKYFSHSPPLFIPHPKWNERLFVLAPLSELVDKQSFPSLEEIQEVLKNFSNPHHEKVIPISGPDPFKEIHTCTLSK